MQSVVETTAGRLIVSKLVAGAPGVVHGFGVRGPDAAAYLDAMGVGDRFIVKTNQVHGNAVHMLMRPRKGPVLSGDAFISDRPGMVCFVRTADCVPILMADARRGAVAAVHAGWRGTAVDVAGSTVRAMREAFGTDPSDLVAAIGPRICGKCYEVGAEVIEAMGKAGLSESCLAGGRRVDLGKANAMLLARAGIPKSRVEVIPRCTSCEREFVSWRRDRTEEERQFNFIVITGEG